MIVFVAHPNPNTHIAGRSQEARRRRGFLLDCSHCFCVANHWLHARVDRASRRRVGLVREVTHARQHKSAVTTARFMTSPITTTTKTYRAVSEFSTKLRAAVSFGAFRFSAPPPPPETAGYVSDSSRAGDHSTPVVAIARARPRDFCLVRPTRRAGP